MNPKPSSNLSLPLVSPTPSTSAHAEVGSVGEFPFPTHDRWKPLRSGLLNLYRYDDEEFWYEDGHLLLRGNNGTGKSRVLALQLPFLLDGEVAPHRLEPDGDPAKRIEWNLLMNKLDERIGYSWIEFGRRELDSQGNVTDFFLTLGCGLKAVKGKKDVDKWFFITPRRIRLELSLQGAGRQPLSREALNAALRASGQIFRTAADYRRAINAHLFKLEEYRYDALVNLLIQLRQPQLSRHLDDARLSAALSEALPPLSPEVIHDVAESFRNLEEDRLSLQGFIAAREGASTFLQTYRHYAQVAARRRSSDMCRAQRDYEQTQQQLLLTERQLDQLASTLATHEQNRQTLDLEISGAEATRDTLRSSPEMQDVHRLNAAREHATRARAQVTICFDREFQAHQDTLDQEKRHQTVTGELEQALTDAETLRNQLQDLAEQAAFLPQHAPLAAFLQTLKRMGEAANSTADPAHLDLSILKVSDQQALYQRMKADLNVRTKGLKQLSDCLHTFDNAMRELHTAEEILNRQESNLSEALERQQQLHIALREHAEAYLLAYEDWRKGLTYLVVPESDDARSMVEHWMETPESKNPLPSQIHQALSHVQEQLYAARATQTQQLKQQQETRERWFQELENLRHGHHQPPPVPHTRIESSREGRRGAPLWRVCEFDTSLDTRARAGLEAALEASGLLDAWITPEGEVFLPNTHEHWLTALPHASTHPAASETSAARSLAQWLHPALDHHDPAAATLSESLITQILHSVGAGRGEGLHWVSLEGDWQLGPLAGHWSKNSAQHIGHAAREHARRERIQWLENQLEACDALIENVQQRLQQLELDMQASRLEASRLPSDQHIVNGMVVVSVQAQQVEGQRTQLIEQQQKVSRYRLALDVQRQKRDELAQDLKLTPFLLRRELSAKEWRQVLEGLQGDTSEYQHKLEALFKLLKDLLKYHRDVREAQEKLETCQEREGIAKQQHLEAKRVQMAADQNVSVLEATVGVAVREIEARLSAVQDRLRVLKHDREKVSQSVETTKIEQAKLTTQKESYIETQERQKERRQQCVSKLKSFVGLKLLSLVGLSLTPTTAAAVTVPNPSSVEADIARPSRSDERSDPQHWSITRTHELALQLEKLLSHISTGEDEWKKLGGTMFSHFQTLSNALLPYDYRPQGEQQDELFIVKVPFQGQPLSVVELHQALLDEINTRQSVLDAREREAIENYLLGDVSSKLHELLHQGEELVTRINRELLARPTSTGMLLRFSWNIDDEQGPTGVEAARTLLLRNTATWSPSEREQLGRFLQAQIQGVRAEHQNGSWQEHLTLALDYRRWHRFVIHRQQDGRWQPLNRRTHGTGSGGEKAIALTIPQFAAAAAHYSSADKRAPRLILLDEAFVGVDSDMRNKCMGLLQTFDLDFMMTSEREWACYPALPGVSICQLATRPGIDAIGLTRWVWNGRERTKVEVRLPSMGSDPVIDENTEE